VTTLQTEFSEAELLETLPIAEPLVAGGVRCHGGYDDSGDYVSPRTKNRLPAIRAWQAQQSELFGTQLLDVPLDRWPENYPNLAQARFLLEQGVNGPLISTLTRIGTVEGFGAMIRYTAVPDIGRWFDDDIGGTAIAHLDRGLFEAHARDEAGYEDEGGHRQMWFAARDVAFDGQVVDVDVQAMLQRMGFAPPEPPAEGSGGYGSAPPPRSTTGAAPERLCPDDLPDGLELLIDSMSRILLIEISAFHVFAWAEALLADERLVGGEGAAAKLVSHIRADETPHVQYLETVLSEMRDRTFRGESGRTYAGTDIVFPLWERAKSDAMGPRRDLNRNAILGEVEHHLRSHPRGGDLLEEFHHLGSIRPGPGGTFVANEDREVQPA
jgi:hypothetical protein